jgi:hypothetical protein
LIISKRKGVVNNIQNGGFKGGNPDEVVGITLIK